MVSAPHRLGREQLGFKPLKRLPSEYVREHIYFSVQYERVAIELRQHVGVDHIMFATDFPHIECEWPNSRPFMDKIYADVPADGSGQNLGRQCRGVFQAIVLAPPHRSQRKGRPK